MVDNMVDNRVDNMVDNTLDNMVDSLVDKKVNQVDSFLVVGSQGTSSAPWRGPSTPPSSPRPGSSGSSSSSSRSFISARLTLSSTKLVDFRTRSSVPWVDAVVDPKSVSSVLLTISK